MTVSRAWPWCVQSSADVVTQSDVVRLLRRVRSESVLRSIILSQRQLHHAFSGESLDSTVCSTAWLDQLTSALDGSIHSSQSQQAVAWRPAATSSEQRGRSALDAASADIWLNLVVISAHIRLRSLYSFSNTADLLSSSRVILLTSYRSLVRIMHQQ